MKTREQVLQLLAQGKAEFGRHYMVRKLGLFGSYARGDHGPDSDVDILVEVDPRIGLEFVSLAEQLEALLGLPVQLVSSRAVKPSALAFIERDLIYV